MGLPRLAPGDLPADAVPGAYYKIGTWGAGNLALHGGTGQVVLFGAADWSSAEDDFDAYFDDEPDDDGEQESSAVLIADSLAAFIDLLQHYLVARCMLAAAGSRIERVAIRDDLEDTLADLDDADIDANFWTAAREPPTDRSPLADPHEYHPEPG
ncbi:hypothetical protein ACQEV2_31170 [Streptomyces sp. CA-251387]|uniref:hypothetical protein n=1 Tax=Streptomyces sp. CA-251387 TaxID=3240064 RepID=UPI003D8AFFB0